MAAVHLVRLDPEPVADDAALPVGREEPVVAGHDAPRRDVRPALERPRLAHRTIRLRAGMVPGLRDDRCGTSCRNSATGSKSGPISTGCLVAVHQSRSPGRGTIALTPDQEANRPAGGDQRRDEAAERLADHDDVLPVADRVDDHVGVLGQAGLLVADRQVHRHHVIAARRQQRRHAVPVPGIAAGTVDEGVRDGLHVPLTTQAPRIHRLGCRTMSDYAIVNLLELDNSLAGRVEEMEGRFGRSPLGARDIGVSHWRYAPNFRSPAGHSHREQEEAYVVVAGSGRVRLGDEVREIRQWDTIRVAPAVVRTVRGRPGRARPDRGRRAEAGGRGRRPVGLAVARVGVSDAKPDRRTARTAPSRSR